MKEKKKLFVIGGIVLILLILGVTLFLIFNKKDDVKEPEDDKIVAPANNTEELIKKTEVLKTETVTEDEIVFSSDIELKENEKVAVWIYSEPKFLGYFEVKVENNVKKIVGLKEALEKIDVDSGNHNIAISNEEGKTLGYVEVAINNSGTLTDTPTNEEDNKDEPENVDDKTTTKQMTETKTIKYSTKKEKDVNMAAGKSKVIQKGANGTKEVTYEVVYDANGKEISRKVLSEKTTKEPVNEIVKVGASDFNLNTDKITGAIMGVLCTKDKSITDNGMVYCDDSKGLEQFNSIIIGDKLVVTNIDANSLTTAIVATKTNGNVYIGTYKGKSYYFDGRAGDGHEEKLTQEICKQYNLSCGAW